MSLPGIADGDVKSSVCLWVHRLGDFHQIYVFDSFGGKDELFRFSGGKVKD